MSSKHLLKNFFLFSIGQWLLAIISFITTPIVTWLIAPEEFGRASMFTLAQSLLLALFMLGTEQSFVRMFHERKGSSRVTLLWESMLPGLFMSVFFGAFFLLFWRPISYLLFDGYYMFPVILLWVVIILSVLNVFASWIVRMKQKGKEYSAIQVTTGVTNAAGIVVYALLFGRNFYAVVFGTLVSTISSLLVAAYFSRDFWVEKPGKIDFRNVSEILKYGIPFVPTFLIMWIFQSMDRIALRSYSTFMEIGLYSAAFKIVSVMNLIRTGFTTFWVPVAYERYGKKPDDRVFYSKMAQIIAATMFLFGALVLAVKDLIFLLLANSYRDAIYISPFLILMPVMWTISEVTVVGINFQKKPYYHIIIAAVTAIVNFVGNNLLVPLYGARGAAVSTGIAYVVLFALRTHFSVKLYQVDYKLKKIFTAAGTFMTAGLVNTFSKSLFFGVCSTLSAFAIILFIYKDQILYVKGIVPEVVGDLKKKLMGR